MGDHFSVFDSWGNKVGDFVPSGGGCVDGLIGILVLIIAWSVGLAIYALIKLIAEGFKALGQGKWGLAIACFIPVWVPIIVGVLLIGGGEISIVNQRNQQSTQVMQQSLDNFPVSLLDARRANCLAHYIGVPGSPVVDNRINSQTVCIYFTVQNNWSGNAWIKPTEGMKMNGEFYPATSEGYYYPCNQSAMLAHSTDITNYLCFEDTGAVMSDLCMDVHLEGYGQPPVSDKTVCVHIISRDE